MTRFLLIICFFVCLVQLCSAQLPLNKEGYADSIIQVLQKEKNDSLKSKLHFILVYNYLAKGDTAKVLYHLMEGRKYGRKYPLMYAQSYAHEGYYYINKDIPRSQAAYMKADSILIGQTSKDAYRVRANS